MSCTAEPIPLIPLMLFTPTGIRRLEVSHVWLSIPFTCIYIASLAGNCTILFAIGTDPSPHEPMYQFLSLMAITHLVSSLSTMPTVMSVFWVNYRENSFRECFALLYFVHFLSFVESSVLLAMAFDCYVTIWYLQRYSSILSSARIGRIGLAALCGYLLGGLPSPAVSSIRCADIAFSNWYDFAVAIFCLTFNIILTFVSYILIAGAILSITSQREHLKALNNCLSCIMAVLILYIPMGGLSMVHQYGQDPSPLVHIFRSNVCLPVLPTLNPVFYSIKTKQIHRDVSSGSSCQGGAPLVGHQRCPWQRSLLWETPT
ncbi:olfactory receptor 51Q1-like [Grus americana]|uniref:olfactory receptor 51Q1-like n=1 Tax=Grus americana TaxID=9117 RepID=UPI002407E4F7|nr:olfactory receptor 51Q1-like [Grus americana]